MIKTIDLCAGIGGIRRGFELTGLYENVLSSEIDEAACRTYKHLYGDDPFNDLTTSEFKSLVKNTDYDVLLAGFPCQTFSRAGKKLGFEDMEKGIIFKHIAMIIKETRPKGIFLENVDNLVRHNNGETFRTIIEVIEKELDYKVAGVSRSKNGELNYDGKNFIRNSKYFGVPQNRPRTYIIAFDRKAYRDRIGFVSDTLPKGNNLRLYDNLNDVLEMGAEPKYYMSSGYLQTLKKHRERQRQKGNGFGYVIVNRAGVTNPIANTLLATGGSGKERNLIIDPQEGIAGLVVTGKHSPINDECVRVMTPREWGKLQGFINFAFVENGHETFSFPEGMKDGQKYKQFGNSVTIPVIKTMAEFVADNLKNIGAVN